MLLPLSMRRILDSGQPQKLLIFHAELESAPPLQAVPVQSKVGFEDHCIHEDARVVLPPQMDFPKLPEIILLDKNTAPVCFGSAVIPLRVCSIPDLEKPAPLLAKLQSAAKPLALPSWKTSSTSTPDQNPLAESEEEVDELDS